MSGGDRRISNPERALWQEVLLRAIADARLDPSSWPVPASAHDEAAEARRYLTTPGEDLEAVCSMAGVEMDALVERIRGRVGTVPIIGETAKMRICTEHRRGSK